MICMNIDEYGNSAYEMNTCMKEVVEGCDGCRFQAKDDTYEYYPTDYFNVWFEGLKDMKEKKNRHEAINEGMIYDNEYR